MWSPTETRQAATPAQQLVELATIMARAVVNTPESVRVNVIGSGRTVVLELSVHPDEVGQVIGKEGIYAGAMRRLLLATAGKLGVGVVLEIINPRLHRR